MGEQSPHTLTDRLVQASAWLFAFAAYVGARLLFLVLMRMGDADPTQFVVIVGVIQVLLLEALFSYWRKRNQNGLKVALAWQLLVLLAAWVPLGFYAALA